MVGHPPSRADLEAQRVHFLCGRPLDPVLLRCAGVARAKRVVAFSSQNTLDLEGVRHPKITDARISLRNSLTKLTRWLLSCLRAYPMNAAANHCPFPKFAVWRFLSLLFTEASLPPPLSGLATCSFNGLHRESISLATSAAHVIFPRVRHN